MTPRITFHTEGVNQYHPFPFLDVVELDDGYLVQVELAGVDPEAVNVSVTRDALVIEGERTPRYPEGAKKVLRMELSYGRFRRELLMPADADASGVTARWTRGLLWVRVPRHTVRHAVEIEVED